MSSDLYVCNKCQTVDILELNYPDGIKSNGDSVEPLYCSKCRTGEWHGLFDQAKYKPGFDQVINVPNELGLGSK